ncbi:YeeE/YedE family protein [Corallococcus sp. CA054B]|uniref:YeeE/YedE family protein n=1 Tax=Corallococcus sp. CA054B TaxID=2316734 RepID=UPI000EA32F47|nr:YeeE/YedE family protein [Corallococcus sp. CA054B]RKG68798.1 YeeE/YedE family protein [Corallococcus sp. CA054B]
MSSSIVLPLVGGVLIGRILFLGGLLTGGLLLAWLRPGGLPASGPLPLGHLSLLGSAGLLVGFGSQLGNGCTSGHGVCGISRGSVRSIVATLTFMATGALTVFFVRHVS